MARAAATGVATTAALALVALVALVAALVGATPVPVDQAAADFVPTQVFALGRPPASQFVELTPPPNAFAANCTFGPNEAELHVFSVARAPLFGAVKVIVERPSAPLVIVLNDAAGVPTVWTLDVSAAAPPPGVTVYATGAADSTRPLKGVLPAAVAPDTFVNATAYPFTAFGANHALPSSDTLAMLRRIEQLTRLKVTSFHGVDAGVQFVVRPPRAAAAPCPTCAAANSRFDPLTGRCGCAFGYYDDAGLCERRQPSVTEVVEPVTSQGASHAIDQVITVRSTATAGPGGTAGRYEYEDAPPGQWQCHFTKVNGGGGTRVTDGYYAGPRDMSCFVPAFLLEPGATYNVQTALAGASVPAFSTSPSARLRVFDGVAACNSLSACDQCEFRYCVYCTAGAAPPAGAGGRGCIAGTPRDGPSVTCAAHIDRRNRCAATSLVEGGDAATDTVGFNAVAHYEFEVGPGELNRNIVIEARAVVVRDPATGDVVPVFGDLFLQFGAEVDVNAAVWANPNDDEHFRSTTIGNVPWGAGAYTLTPSCNLKPGRWYAAVLGKTPGGHTYTLQLVRNCACGSAASAPKPTGVSITPLVGPRTAPTTLTVTAPSLAAAAAADPDSIVCRFSARHCEAFALGELVTCGRHNDRESCVTDGNDVDRCAWRGRDLVVPARVVSAAAAPGTFECDVPGDLREPRVLADGSVLGEPYPRRLDVAVSSDRCTYSDPLVFHQAEDVLVCDEPRGVAATDSQSLRPGEVHVWRLDTSAASGEHRGGPTAVTVEALTQRLTDLPRTAAGRALPEATAPLDIALQVDSGDGALPPLVADAAADCASTAFGCTQRMRDGLEQLKRCTVADGEHYIAVRNVGTAAFGYSLAVRCGCFPVEPLATLSAAVPQAGPHDEFNLLTVLGENFYDDLTRQCLFDDVSGLATYDSANRAFCLQPPLPADRDVPNVVTVRVAGRDCAVDGPCSPSTGIPYFYYKPMYLRETHETRMTAGNYVHYYKIDFNEVLPGEQPGAIDDVKSFRFEVTFNTVAKFALVVREGTEDRASFPTAFARREDAIEAGAYFVKSAVSPTQCNVTRETRPVWWAMVQGFTESASYPYKIELVADPSHCVPTPAPSPTPRPPTVAPVAPTRPDQIDGMRPPAGAAPPRRGGIAAGAVALLVALLVVVATSSLLALAR